MIRRENNIVRRRRQGGSRVLRGCCCYELPQGSCYGFYLGKARHTSLPDGYPMPPEGSIIEARPACIRDLVYMNKLAAQEDDPLGQCQDRIYNMSPDYVLRRVGLEAPEGEPCPTGFVPRYHYVTCPPVYFSNSCDFNRVSSINADYTLPPNSGRYEVDNNAVFSDVEYDFADILTFIQDEVCYYYQDVYSTIIITMEIWRWKHVKQTPRWLDICSSKWWVNFFAHEEYLVIPPCPDLFERECIPR